jgi:hypothetical protein
MPTSPLRDAANRKAFMRPSVYAGIWDTSLLDSRRSRFMTAPSPDAAPGASGEAGVHSGGGGSRNGAGCVIDRVYRVCVIDRAQGGGRKAEHG